LRSIDLTRADREGDRVTGTASATNHGQADDLRTTMVDDIARRHKALGRLLAADVRRALLTVPRHLFAEGDADVEGAYADQAIVTKRDERGVSVSSVSAPWLQAMMIGQAEIAPGMRVMEIGSGGYNAALLREIVGDGGQVTTVDIDSEVTDRARRCLGAAGYDDIEVICADAEFALAPGRTFDAIIVTVGAWDIPASWPSQLGAGGRLVVPLRTWGMTRSWVLEQRDGTLVSTGQLMCGFVPMRGAGEHRGASVPLLGDGVVGLWQDEGGATAVEELAGVLNGPRTETWTGITIAANVSSGDLDLWLATTLSGFCLMTARQESIDDGTVNPSWRYGTPALVDGPNLAYRASPRPVDGPEGPREFGSVGHGPDAARTARVLTEQISAWDDAGRPSPRLTVLPAGTPDAELPAGFLLDKRHTRLSISWPTVG
jgi:protein-L-isoaspartate(D-aspartate) O-methyltransferase